MVCKQMETMSEFFLWRHTHSVVSQRSDRNTCERVSVYACSPIRAVKSHVDVDRQGSVFFSVKDVMGKKRVKYYQNMVV